MESNVKYQLANLTQSINTEVRDIEINQVDDRNVNGYYSIKVEVSKVKKSIIITCKLKLKKFLLRV